MNLHDIAVFVEAVQGGSLAAAARRLEIPAMTATRRLAALETELGLRLMHRTTRALALTPEGEAFLPHALAMLEEEANARAALTPSDAGASGLLRVTTSGPFGRKVLMRVVPGFLRANPEARVDLHLADSIVDIVAMGIDLAIRQAPLRDSTLVARKLSDNPRWLYAAPPYLAARGTPSRVSDLAGHDCLAATDTTHWSFDQGGRRARHRIAGRFSGNSIEALHQACLDGLGITMLTAWNAAEDVGAGRLVRLPLDDGEPEPLGIWAVFPTARQVPPKVRIFVAALEGHLRSLTGAPQP